MSNQPFIIVEIDMDYCSLTFGNAPCMAALSASTSFKCFNTYNTCSSKPNFNRVTKTLRYCQASAVIPRGGLYFPVIQDVKYESPQVNLAGSDKDIRPLGVRGSASIVMADFPYHDRHYDKYEQERYDGTAQFNGVTQDQSKISTHFAKLKARWPFYSGRALRILEGTISNEGVFTENKRRHYVIEDMDGPGEGQSVTIIAKDILKLADDDRAVMPKPSTGKLTDDLDDEGTTFTVSHPDQYTESGWVVVGNEIIQYTRSGGTFTAIERNARGTELRSHREGDTVQQVYAIRGQEAWEVIRDLLQDGAGIDPAFIPDGQWKQEVDIWFSNTELEGDIVKPTGVNELLSEFSNLGFTIWWDEVEQQIKLRYNRPAWGDDEIHDLTEDASLIAIAQEDQDDKRINQVEFRIDTIDPTKSHTDLMNYRIMEVVADAELAGPLAYNDTRIRQIQCRVLDNGNDAAARIAARRLLNRFRLAPKRVEVEIDYKDDLKIADVVRLRSRYLVNADGTPATELYQVIRRQDSRIGARVKLTLQRYFYTQRYVAITTNNVPVYGSATQEQKEQYAFFAASDGTQWGAADFSDGQPPYNFI